MFDGSVTDNIAYPSNDDDMEKIIDAAKQSQAHEFIEKLPNGYDSMIGERGQKLSAGQKQRIAIARAIYKNPPILVFDEATSALDTMTEQKVMSSISQSNKDITIILVTHRLSTVKDCDIIFELESGRIIAQGSYNQLLQSSKAFKKMVEA